MDRRLLGKAMTAALAAGFLPGQAGAAAPNSRVDRRPFTFSMIIFDKMTNLGSVGPKQTFGGYDGIKIHVLGKTIDPVVTDTGAG